MENDLNHDYKMNGIHYPYLNLNASGCNQIKLFISEMNGV